MAKVKADKNSNDKPMRPPLTQDALDSRMISLAYDLVQQRLIDGTASSQETTHFLKLATKKAKLENTILEKQAELIAAKKKALDSTDKIEKLYTDAIVAMKHYAGHGDLDDDY